MLAQEVNILLYLCVRTWVDTNILVDSICKTNTKYYLKRILKSDLVSLSLQNINPCLGTRHGSSKTIHLNNKSKSRSLSYFGSLWDASFLRLPIFKFNSQSDCLDLTWTLSWAIMRPNCQLLWVPSWKCTLSLWLSCRGVALFSELPRSISIGFCRLQTPSMGVSFDRWDLAGWLLLRTQSCLCYLMGWLGQSFPNLKKKIIPSWSQYYDYEIIQ